MKGLKTAIALMMLGFFGLLDFHLVKVNRMQKELNLLKYGSNNKLTADIKN